MKPILIPLLIITLGLTSCIKEINPQGVIVTGEQAMRAPGAYQNFVSTITSSLGGSFFFSGSDTRPSDFGYTAFLIMRDLMGNDITVDDSSSDWFDGWYRYSYRATDNTMTWSYYYSWIKNCNIVISLAGDKPQEDQISGLGIAYSMRAMFYMDLARMYSRKRYADDKTALTVPIVLENTTLTELASNPRATNEAIWNLIISDLNKAEEYLANYQRKDKSTPDISVVYGLKARAYLTMEDWENAELYARMAKEGYSLLNEAQYTSRTDGFNTPNDAWMFAFTFKSTDPNITANDADSSWGSQMILEVNESDCGYIANYGTSKKIDRHLYETIPSSDYRKNLFIDFSIDELDDIEDIIDALSFYSDVPMGVYNSSTATASKLLGGVALKFRPKDGVHDNQYQAFLVSVPLMRVEEMYLIEAEAAGMQDLGRGISLLTAFAQTRDSEYVYGTHSLETYGSYYATPFQNEVWWQRRVEFWGEGLSFYDMKRLDKGLIRNYEGTNHISSCLWNYGDYPTSEGNVYPNIMDMCFPLTETNYNVACEPNPMPIIPSKTSSIYEW